jgi:outer membrane protein assembly factor BamB
VKKLAILALVVAACGPKAVFRLSAEDNDRSALVAALAQRKLPAQPAPMNSAQKPRMFVEVAGTPKLIVAYDLAAGSVMWSVAADAKSRVQVGGDFVAELEGNQLVARDQQRGTVRWKIDAPGPFVGAAADRDHVYATWRQGTDQKASWRLAAYDGATGAMMWKQDSEGQLGAPLAQGGLVYSPFLTQWLSILDGTTGRQLARIRNSEDQISVVRVTSTDAFYGSKQGVYRLDARSANGTRAGGTFAKVTLPTQLDRAAYGRDVYDPVQLAYTASDRARVLYAEGPSDAGPLKFANDLYAIHYFRYVIGFTVTGELAWAYSHPRVELVASEHTGAAILAVSGNGQLVALEPKTGGVMLDKAIGVTGTVLGATFDADGWAPPMPQTEAVETAQALVSIARDRDARFDKVKELAVSALVKQSGPEVTSELLALLADSRVSQRIKDQVTEVLTARRDPASLHVLVAQLAVHDDYLAKTEALTLGSIAKSISGLGGVKLDPKEAAAALAALRSHLDAPTTQTPDLVIVINAMAAIGEGAERVALASHMLLYHADDDLGGDTAWAKTITAALYAHGGPGEREMLRQVGNDPRTKAPLAAAIKDALAAGD